MTYLAKYRDLRGACEEVEYNFGRAFHQIGLFYLAVRHYQKVLELEKSSDTTSTSEHSFKKEAAHNLFNIYMVTGSTMLAKVIAQRWLTI